MAAAAPTDDPTIIPVCPFELELGGYELNAMTAEDDELKELPGSEEVIVTV